MESMMPILYFVGGMVSGVILFMIFQRKNESSSQSRADEMQRAHEAQIETLQKSQAAQLEALRTHQGEQIAALKESQAQQIETLTASQQQQTRALKEEFERERKQMQENQAQQIETLTASQQEQTRALKEEFEHERKRLQERMAKQEEDMRRENVAQFKALASEILTVQTAGLKQTNTEQLKAVLGPLAENIESFRKAVNDSYVQESASRKSLSDQIDRLMRLNETIGTDAKNLTSALRGNSKVQGDWGEMILETMLENAGLEEGIHFTSQATRQADGTMLRDEQGALQRPDVIVSMPDSRKLIIDSKVSLTAFVDLCAARDEHERRDWCTAQSRIGAPTHRRAGSQTLSGHGTGKRGPCADVHPQRRRLHRGHPGRRQPLAIRIRAQRGHRLPHPSVLGHEDSLTALGAGQAEPQHTGDSTPWRQALRESGRVCLGAARRRRGAQESH